MSLIVIDSPFDGTDSCATCLQYQLIWFRNQIKEQWNAANNDGKVGHTIRIPLRLNPDMLMEPGATMVNGNFVCVTHMFNDVNAMIEQQTAMAEAAKKPKLHIAEGSMDGFTRRNGN